MNFENAINRTLTQTARAIKRAGANIKPTSVPLKPGVSKLDLSLHGGGVIQAKRTGKGLYDWIEITDPKGIKVTLKTTHGMQGAQTVEKIKNYKGKNVQYFRQYGEAVYYDNLLTFTKKNGVETEITSPQAFDLAQNIQSFIAGLARMSKI